MTLFGLFLSTVSITDLNAALSATSANSIQGTKPYLKLSIGAKLTTLDELLGFSFPDGGGGLSQIDASMAGTMIIASKNMKFSDVNALITADGIPHAVGGVLADDDDGDANILSDVTISGTMMATWYDGDLNEISNLNQTLSECGGPYLLKISADNVSVSTKYGNPTANNYGSHSGVTYSFIGSNSGICYIKPANMEVRSGIYIATDVLSKFPYVDAKNPGGYNPALWEYDSVTSTHKGFSVKNMKTIGTRFPTVGFYKASYDVIGSGSDQSNYRCKTTSSFVSLSGGGTSSLGLNCKVTYNTITKPSTGYTIIMEFTTDGGTSWDEIDRYTVSAPTEWVRVLGGEKFNDLGITTGVSVYAAANLCAGNALGTTMTDFQAKSYFLPRSSWTNTPKILTTNTELGYFSRDIDGTFMGEWGELYTNSYPNSKFNEYKQVWTSETYNSTKMYIIHTVDGDQSFIDSNTYAVVACKN